MRCQNPVQRNFIMSDVIKANIEVHTHLANVYNKDEPHFRPENKAKVSRRLEKMKLRTDGEKLLDLGCGTGFIIDLARSHFSSITGVDITPAMLEKVNVNGHDIQLHNGQVESLPFEDNTFSAASAYSFLDHLEDQKAMLVEALRVLKPGAEFYIDLVPNRFYWNALKDEDCYELTDSSAFVVRERKMVTENDKLVEKEYGINAKVFRAAEPAKETNGVDPYAFKKLALEAGFLDCEVHYDWFLGNAKVLHQQSEEDAKVVQNYLEECLPISKHMFKYVWFVLKKGE